MPVFKQYTESSYKWGIWKTSESLEELLALLPHKEKYEEGIGKFTAIQPMRKTLYPAISQTTAAINN